jgi:hypothetical protein
MNIHSDAVTPFESLTIEFLDRRQRSGRESPTVIARAAKLWKGLATVLNSSRRITESACGDDAGLVFRPAGVHFLRF